jgi:hypothetical protein
MFGHVLVPLPLRTHPLPNVNPWFSEEGARQVVFLVFLLLVVVIVLFERRGRQACKRWQGWGAR